MNTDKTITQLTTIESASCEAVKVDGKSTGVLTLSTGSGVVKLDLDQFDAIYAGFVKCWPSIKPVKQEIILARREEIKAEAVSLREAKEAAGKAERKQAAEARQKVKDDAKAAKDAAKAKAVELKAAEAKAKADAKLKADSVKLAEATKKADAAGKLDKTEKPTGSVDKAMAKARKDGKLPAKK